jgi:hypothetical protein
LVRVVGCAEKDELCILWGIAEVIAVAVGILETLPCGNPARKGPVVITVRSRDQRRCKLTAKPPVQLIRNGACAAASTS